MDFEGALRKFSKTVYGIAFTNVKNRHDAEDILQDVFLKYFKSGMEFDNDEELKYWLIRVTVNTSKNHLRSAWLRRTEQLDESKLPDFSADYGNDSVYSAVLALPIKYRQPVILFYYNDLPVKEIAQILKRNESTVKSQLSRARDMLKEILIKEYEYEI